MDFDNNNSSFFFFEVPNFPQFVIFSTIDF